MIYIASPFFNEEELNFVKKIESALDSNKIDYFSPRSEGILIDQSEEEKKKNKRKIYLSNINNIQKCSMMVAVIDGRDTGTIWEMGYATALEKRIISITNKDYGLNVMIAESVWAHVKNISDMILAISNPEFKGEDITDVF